MQTFQIDAIHIQEPFGIITVCCHKFSTQISRKIVSQNIPDCNPEWPHSLLSCCCSGSQSQARTGSTLDKLHLSAKLKTKRTLDCDWSHGQHVHYYLRLIRQKLSLRPARSKENKLKLPHYIAL